MALDLNQREWRQEYLFDITETDRRAKALSMLENLK